MLAELHIHSIFMKSKNFWDLRVRWTVPKHRCSLFRNPHLGEHVYCLYREVIYSYKVPTWVYI